MKLRTIYVMTNADSLCLERLKYILGRGACCVLLKDTWKRHTIDCWGFCLPNYRRASSASRRGKKKTVSRFQEHLKNMKNERLRRLPIKVLFFTVHSL